MARPQSTTGNACRAVLWLLPLVAFLALPAHASTPRSSTDALELDSTPHVSIALDVAALELTDDAPSFELGEASLLAELRQEHFHLDGAELLSEEPRRAPPLSYPETRVRGFDFLGQEVIGLFEGVTLELRWGCERFGLGISEGNGVNLYAFVGQRPHEFTDPTGQAIPVDEVWDAVSLLVDFGFAGYEWATEGKVTPATTTAIGIDLTALMIPYLPGGGALARVTGGAAVMASSAAKVRSGVRAAQGATKGVQIAHQMMRSHSTGGTGGDGSGSGSSSGVGSNGPSGPKAPPEETRTAIELSRQRAGNRQLKIGEQRWNVPKGTDVSRIPASDVVGDQLQRAATDAAKRWNKSLLSQNEAAAIQKAFAAKEPWKANLLEAQARGRWVESQVRTQFPNLSWSRVGVDATDKGTGLAYEVLSGSEWNVGEHMRRMSDQLFRLITF